MNDGIGRAGRWGLSRFRMLAASETADSSWWRWHASQVARADGGGKDGSDEPPSAVVVLGRTGCCGLSTQFGWRWGPIGMSNPQLRVKVSTASVKRSRHPITGEVAR
jgi:hypothetical protein